MSSLTGTDIKPYSTRRQHGCTKRNEVHTALTLRSKRGSLWSHTCPIPNISLISLSMLSLPPRRGVHPPRPPAVAAVAAHAGQVRHLLDGGVEGAALEPRARGGPHGLRERATRRTGEPRPTRIAYRCTKGARAPRGLGGAGGPFRRPRTCRSSCSPRNHVNGWRRRPPHSAARGASARRRLRAAAAAAAAAATAARDAPVVR